jgi:hypothetical protein
MTSRCLGRPLPLAFDRPGVLERTYYGPLGAATGTERLQIRLYDLLAPAIERLVAFLGRPVEARR